jgi:hypothetical protein
LSDGPNRAPFEDALMNVWIEGPPPGGDRFRVITTFEALSHF